MVDEYHINPEELRRHVSEHMTQGSDEQWQTLMHIAVYSMEEDHPKVAKRIFEDLLRKEPNNIDLRCFLICSLAQLGFHDKAEEALNSMIKRNPHHRYSNVNMGILLRKQRKTQQSRVYFFLAAKLLERSQGEYSIDRFLEEGKEHIANGRNKKALEVLSPLTEEIGDLELLVNLGRIQLAEKQYDHAKEAFLRIIKMDRANAAAKRALKELRDIFVMQAEDAIKRKDLEKAGQLLDQAVGIAPAKDILQRAITINTMIQNDRRVVELKDMLRKVEAHERNKQIEEHLARAESHEGTGQYIDALRLYEAAVLIEPRQELYRRMIEVCQKMKRSDLAEKLTAWYHEQKESWEKKQRDDGSGDNSKETA